MSQVDSQLSAIAAPLTGLSKMLLRLDESCWHPHEWVCALTDSRGRIQPRQPQPSADPTRAWNMTRLAATRIPGEILEPQRRNESDLFLFCHEET
eukprot:768364-Hanusia_phi.AAC.2